MPVREAREDGWRRALRGSLSLQRGAHAAAHAQGGGEQRHSGLARAHREVPEGQPLSAVDWPQYDLLQGRDQVARLVRVSPGSARMERLPFGRTDLSVSPLCLGTMSMGSSAWKRWVLDERDSIPILR